MKRLLLETDDAFERALLQSVRVDGPPKDSLEKATTALTAAAGVVAAGAAMAAAATTLGRKVSEQMHGGTLSEVAVQAEEGALYVYSAGSKAILVVLSPQGGNAGLIHLESRDAAKQIGELF